MTKYGICIECNDELEKPIIAGRCTHKHYWAYRKKISLEKKGSRANQHIINVKGNNTGLPLWYASKMKRMTGRCMECGEKIEKFNPKYAICAIAHILPKSIFKSVATHENNWLELGATCGCHSRYDKSWESASKMKIWSIAVERFKTFEHLIVLPEELRKIPTYLYTYNLTYI